MSIINTAYNRNRKLFKVKETKMKGIIFVLDVAVAIGVVKGLEMYGNYREQQGYIKGVAVMVDEYAKHDGKIFKED